MLKTDTKILVHFNTGEITLSSLQGGNLTLLDKKQVDFTDASMTEAMAQAIDNSLSALQARVGVLTNANVRLYATGIFQQLERTDKVHLINHVFVNHGVYLNIIPPDLEQFYLDKSSATSGADNVIDGLVQQEFRTVVVCGSFQQSLTYIENVVSQLRSRNVAVLSPWTTKIRPETIGTNFILFEGQNLRNERDTWRLKYEHMDKFRRSDAIIVCAPDGLVGKGTMFEFGFMVALAKRIIFTEKPKELSILFPYEVGLNF